MKRKIVLLLIAFTILITITGCGKNKDGSDNVKFDSNIEIGKKQYIEQLKKVSIGGTDDYLIITERIKWEVPEHEDGDTVNYITFFISLSMLCISIYSQRTAEAKKDEELELLATTDTLTGLYAFEYFTSLVNKKCEEKEVLVKLARLKNVYTKRKTRTL